MSNMANHPITDPASSESPTFVTGRRPARSSGNLFEPIRLGAIEAPNRIFMAPMTRARGTREHVPTPMMADYYAQRAGAGLIITEAIGISQQGLGWPYATGLWSKEQVAGWRRVTEAVHHAGGRILAQLWHMGRIVHPSYLQGERPISASAIAAPGEAYTYDGKQPHVVPLPLGLDEIPALLEQYRASARNALAAGFDGVQVHAANGYLLDQFLCDSSNVRDDAYGGSVTNRIRLLREVAATVADAVGADRTGIRLSPNTEVQGVRDSDPLPLFLEVMTTLSALGIAHVELREPPLDGTFGVGHMAPLAPRLRDAFAGPVILNADFDAARAVRNLAAGVGDAITFGRPFIANPDLPERIARKTPWTQSDPDTWFSQGAEGYLDYPRCAHHADNAD